jgi:hypothetical protein
MAFGALGRFLFGRYEFSHKPLQKRLPEKIGGKNGWVER